MEKVRLYSPVEIGMILLLIHYDPSKTEMAEQELLTILAYVSGYQSGGKKEKVSPDIFLELISIPVSYTHLDVYKRQTGVIPPQIFFNPLKIKAFCGYQLINSL